MDAARYFLCLWACFIVGGLDGAQWQQQNSLFMPQASSYFHFPPAGHTLLAGRFYFGILLSFISVSVVHASKYMPISASLHRR